MEFKDRVKSLRNERGISQTQLASELGKGESAVRMWEIGRSKPDADTLIKLSEYFDCSTDYLLGISDGKNNEEIKAINEDLDTLAVFATSVYNESQPFIRHLIDTLLPLSNNSEVDSKHHLNKILEMLANGTTVTDKYIEKSSWAGTLEDFIRYGSEINSIERKAQAQLLHFFLKLKAASIDAIFESCEDVNRSVVDDAAKMLLVPTKAVLYDLIPDEMKKEHSDFFVDDSNE